MNIARTTEPAAEPITLAEAKAHCRVIDFEDDDTYITGLIAVARLAIENMTGRTLIDTVYTQHVRTWQASIQIARGNARTVGSVKYDDLDGNEQTVDAADYGLVPYGDGAATLAFFDTFTDPDLLDRPGIDRIRIQFTAGYGATAAAVPETLRQAVLYLVAHYYDNRSPIGVNVNLNKLPLAVESLIAPYVIYLL